MSKLAVFALLGMLALAAAADVGVQKKVYRKDDYDYGKEDYEYKKEAEEYEKEYKKPEPKVVEKVVEKIVYKPVYPPPSKANVESKHKEWDLEEVVIKTHPCAEEYEILGSTVAQSADLYADNKNVGSVFWSGVVTQWDTCGHCKDYKAKTEHIVKVNYQVTFEFTEEHKGQIVCNVVANSIFSEDSVTCAVTGGTGAFEGASGEITWTFAKPRSKYSFDIYLPKIVEVKDYSKEGEKKEEPKEEKYFV